ncbi:N(2)-fixation sustaining protein CowN [Aestuariirhabdus sp. LZHN29]|uniref:N(2)-fixation sustaining protein CowN n=1 Tax=Aestuariirhabdus sp. LZHN29 TaxID=3417462 RepID=UPI003CF88FB9
MNHSPCSDRYVSFCGLDCEQRASSLMHELAQIIHQFEPDNRFWNKFLTRAQGEGAPDALFMIHSYVFYLRELLEDHEQEQALEWLQAIEEQCC